MTVQIKATCMLLVAFFYSQSALPADAEILPTASNVYQALPDESGAPLREARKEFECTDKIFTIIELENFEVGQHQLSVRWIDPSGQQREHTQYPFYVRGPEEHRLWAWLLLSRATGAAMLTFINPAAGLEEFIGEWTVEVRVSNKLLDTSEFLVVC